MTAVTALSVPKSQSLSLVVLWFRQDIDHHLCHPLLKWFLLLPLLLLAEWMGIVVAEGKSETSCYLPLADLQQVENHFFKFQHKCPQNFGCHNHMMSKIKVNI